MAQTFLAVDRGSPVIRCGPLLDMPRQKENGRKRFTGNVQKLVDIIASHAQRQHWIHYDEDFKEARVQPNNILKLTDMWREIIKCTKKNLRFPKQYCESVMRNVRDKNKDILKLKPEQKTVWPRVSGERFRAQASHIMNNMCRKKPAKWTDGLLEDFININIDININTNMYINRL